MTGPSHQEGWSVPVRLPLVVAALAIAILTGALLVVGAAYDRGLARQVRPPAFHMPAPHLELTQTPPNLDRQDTRQPPPAGIDRAMRDAAARGDRLWQGGTP